MSNARINSILSTLVDSYITNMIEPTGYSTHVTMYIDNEDEESKLLLIDPESDTGTYRFYKKDGALVVTDYFDSDVVYGVYKDEMQFNTDYDLPVSFQHISDLLDIFIENNGYAYIGIDSHFITHEELMKREGWTDRRIKKEFGIMPLDELDRVRYYRLNEVIAKEQI
ncbi:hypothetical protein QZP90_18065 [Serratia marcescens]|uniref:hypothetical protein n=1 Tax=Serratia TaxID=613 RepID=UPI0007456742|nr:MULTISPECIES: hypothetical protein [Serratia]MDP8611150.1 hypothetical protein [Serratia marcescens]MDP8626449.1 hypothetical protein [Serratia marcescens]MDP8675883.1 hypothetical protein [Serratia marcescens]MDP8680739.1 hypothetical protein [Serratia marcescens]MDP8690886.1 hypothetical protein [Serratia marcescens]